jgi:hypothetical protein
MIYQGAGFSWEPVDVRTRRMRVVAAAALLTAGWAAGFFSGRMSAWLLPVAGTESALVEKLPSRGYATAQTTTDHPTVLKSPDGQQVADAASEPPPAPAATTRQKVDAPPPQVAASGDQRAYPTTINMQDDLDSPQPAPGSAERSKADGRAVRAAPPKGKAAARDLPRAGAQWTVLEPRQRPSEDDGANPISADRPEQAVVMECERRYASFRRSDGTYQPFNSRSRELCPLLR